MWKNTFFILSIAHQTFTLNSSCSSSRKQKIKAEISVISCSIVGCSVATMIGARFTCSRAALQWRQCGCSVDRTGGRFFKNRNTGCGALEFGLWAVSRDVFIDDEVLYFSLKSMGTVRRWCVVSRGDELVVEQRHRWRFPVTPTNLFTSVLSDHSSNGLLIITLFYMH